MSLVFFSFVLFLLAIVLSVFLRCTDSDYLITPLVSSDSSSLLRHVTTFKDIRGVIQY